MKELYFGALDLSPYLESITNGYILNLRDVPDDLRATIETVYAGSPIYLKMGDLSHSLIAWRSLGKGQREHNRISFIGFIGKAGERIAFHFIE